MPIENFPFSANGGGIARPYLPVLIINPHMGKRVSTFALIDTGADECAIPAGYAFILGHDLVKGREKIIGTGNGYTAAYTHTTTMEIFHPVTKSVIYRMSDIPVDFLPNLHAVLLGASNFLDRFILTVDYPQQIFSIKYPPNHHVSAVDS